MKFAITPRRMLSSAAFDQTAMPPYSRIGVNVPVPALSHVVRSANPVGLHRPITAIDRTNGTFQAIGLCRVALSQPSTEHIARSAISNLIRSLVRAGDGVSSTPSARLYLAPPWPYCDTFIASACDDLGSWSTQALIAGVAEQRSAWALKWP